jgi:paraquat-inducible protein A
MTQTLIACHHCDLLHRLPVLPEKSDARCRRCGSVLVAPCLDTVDRTLAGAITGLLLLVIANLFPFLLLESQGSVLETTLITGTLIISGQIMPGLGLLVLCTSIVFPCLFLGALTYVLLPLKRGVRPPGARRLFRLALRLRPWSMTEVFLLGVLVSVVKLAKLATIIPGKALFAFLLLVFVLAAVNIFLDPYTIWKRMDECR